jgi:hypothetical protein
MPSRLPNEINAGCIRASWKPGDALDRGHAAAKIEIGGEDAL